MLPDEVLRAIGQEEVVGDLGNLLGLAPGALQHPGFAFQRAALLLLVERHLEVSSIQTFVRPLPLAIVSA